MISRLFVLIILLVAATNQSCRQPADNKLKNKKSVLDSPSYNSLLPKAKPKTRTTIYDPHGTGVSDSEIYAFMADYIDHTESIFVIDPEPFDSPDSMQLIEYLNNAKEANQRKLKDGTMVVSYPQSISLTKDDYDFMTRQFQRRGNFKWDIRKIKTRRLFRFGDQNQNHYARLSIPLFSRDKKRVLISADNSLIGGTSLYHLHHGHWVDKGNEIPFDYIR